MVPARPLVAVVDDEESVRRALARMLGASQFDVDVFASGQEFLDSLRTRLPDCLILDYRMPGLTGRDVQRRLTLAQTQVPIIVVTSYALSGDDSKAQAAGCDAYVTKPYSPRQLLAKIKEFLP